MRAAGAVRQSPAESELRGLRCHRRAQGTRPREREGPADEAERRRIAKPEARVAELEEQATILEKLARSPKAGNPENLSPRLKVEYGER